MLRMVGGGFDMIRRGYIIKPLHKSSPYLYVGPNHIVCWTLFNGIQFIQTTLNHVVFDQDGVFMYRKSVIYKKPPIK